VELDRHRYRHIDEIQKIIREHNEASKELSEIRPAALEWHDQELMRLGVRRPNAKVTGPGEKP
jgi:hypothetical protein